MNWLIERKRVIGLNKNGVGHGISVVFGNGGDRLSKRRNKTFTQTKNGITLQMEYTYKGDMILQQKATNTMPYAIFPVETLGGYSFLDR